MFIGKALEKIRVLERLHKVDERSAAVKARNPDRRKCLLTMPAAKLAIEHALTDEVGGPH
jgi:hypothetical protein